MASEANTSSQDQDQPYSGRDLDSLREEENILERKISLFGKNLNEIPCFRNSFLYGITGGIGTGIVHFAVSSRIRGATTFGFWSYVGITFSYWCYCRYNFSVLKFQYNQLQYALREATKKAGTAEALPKSVNPDDVREV